MQTSLHHNDEHPQTNVGFGVRYSSNDYLIGGNVFFDYDLSQSHARIGFGLEYWRDFLKFGFNSYFRMSGWKLSSDVVDYQARPAHGRDIRAEGYLPDWPQLGGKLVYEQYYGNEVALFGKDDRQRGPYAVTIGTRYTPFPLLTLNAEQRQGKPGESEMRWGMEFNYRLHEPWHQQIDPGQVTALRRIVGSRFDFVDRNNQIVLEYRKTRLHHLFIPPLLMGYGGEQKAFPISVNSKYALARIDGSASALLAQGGKNIRESNDRFSVQLPHYRPEGDNSYSMSAVAVDTQGNMSRSATTQVTGLEAEVSALNSTLEPESISLPANGKAANLINLTVSDVSGNRVPNVQIHLQADNGAEINATALTDAQGEARVSLTNTRAGNTTVTANIKGSSAHPVTLVFQPDEQTAQVVELLPSAAAYLADGQSPVHYRALIKDAQGNAVPGVRVNRSSDRDARVVRFSATQSLSNDEGIAVTTLTSRQAFGVTVTALSPFSTRVAETITFTTSALSEEHSSLRLYPTTLVAGKEKAVLQLTWRDRQGHSLPGQRVVAVSDKSDVLFGETKALGKGCYRIEVSSTVAQDMVVFWQPEGHVDAAERITRTDANEVAHITLKSQTASILRMTAYLNDRNQKKAPDVTIDPAAVDQHASRCSADKMEIGSDGRDAALLNVTLRDAYGNAISGKTVAFHGAESLSGFTITPTHDNNDGSYQARALSMEKGRVSLKASVEGKTIGSAVVISVGAVMPDLRFDNAQQKVTFTQQFRHSQTVKGAPAALQQMWSSSDPGIASVAKGTGQITWHKAGSVTITVQTEGNVQYHPASASYPLQIAKASPGLGVKTKQIVAVWGEGKTYSVEGHFTNSDVGSALPLTDQSDQERVVQVTGDGELRPIAPGNAMISLRTPETAQFLSETVNVSYVLSKGCVPIRFATDVVTTTDLSVFTLQKPTNLPADASFEWSSSEQDVIAITPQGQISGPLKKGKTRLRLTIQENAFYTTSIGADDVQVFTTPKPSKSGVKYGNNGFLVASGHVWAPVFTEDKLRVIWAVNSSTPYDASRYVEVTLVDEWGRKRDHQSIDSPTGSVETVFSPREHYIGKRVHEEVVAFGHEVLQGKTSTSEVNVNPTKPTQIYGSHWTTTYASRRIITSTGEYDDACQSSYFGRMHYALVQPNTRFDLDGQRQLMAPLTIVHKVVDGLGDTKNVNYPLYPGVFSSANVGYRERSHAYAIKEECWVSHSGTGILQTRMTFTAMSEVTNHPFRWHG